MDGFNPLPDKDANAVRVSEFTAAFTRPAGQAPAVWRATGAPPTVIAAGLCDRLSLRPEQIWAAHTSGRMALFTLSGDDHPKVLAFLDGDLQANTLNLALSELARRLQDYEDSVAHLQGHVVTLRGHIDALAPHLTQDGDTVA